jgi:hypothetical protein
MGKYKNFYFFGKEAKERKIKRKYYSRRKKVLIASFLRRSRRPYRGETWVKKSISDEAPSLANKFAHWFPSLSV